MLTELKHGTQANETKTEWIYQHGTPLKTLIFSAYRDNKWIYVSLHNTGDLDDIKEIAYSLKLK